MQTNFINNLKNNINWLWKRFWGNSYRIIFTDKLKDDEILFYNHKLYLSVNINKYLKGGEYCGRSKRNH